MTNKFAIKFHNIKTKKEVIVSIAAYVHGEWKWLNGFEVYSSLISYSTPVICELGNKTEIKDLGDLIVAINE